MRAALLTLLLVASTSTSALAGGSTCFGTPANGRLEHGVRLPLSGPNFSAYSSAAANLGRTYVHSTVATIVGAAYHALEQAAPETRFVYGETGWAAGGRFRPHRTHQNGLSVDFMVPVRDRSGRSVPLPTRLTNRFGYDIEFDQNGKFEDLTIDFPAMAEHLYQLQAAARAQQTEIALVIFDPPFLPRLFATARGPFLERNIKFMRTPAWVRHDEHYHVDFALACTPLKPKAGGPAR